MFYKYILHNKKLYYLIYLSKYLFNYYLIIIPFQNKIYQGTSFYPEAHILLKQLTNQTIKFKVGQFKG